MNSPMPAGALAIPTTPINDIVNSLTNPRKRFDENYLNELAASIKDHGLIQPITLRPISVNRVLAFNRENPNREDLAAVPPYEIVVGECRWRPAKIAGLQEVPAFWRDLSDDQVLEMQVIENLQRKDIHEMEEAEGYEQMMKLLKIKAEDIGARIGKSRAYVYARLKLLDLKPQAREAFFNGELSASTALLIARISDDKLQGKALKEVTKGVYGNGSMSYRQAAEHIQRNYMLKLSDAPFSRTDEDLVPGAGRCHTCPKRTGSNPDLFDDVKSPDVCTDPTCFEAKKAAHAKQQLDLAKSQDRKVISGSDAEKIMPINYAGVRLSGGMARLDQTVWIDGKNKTVAQLIGKDEVAKADLLVNPHNKADLIEVMPKTAIAEALKAKGITVSEFSNSSKTPEEKEAARKERERAKVDKEFRTRLHTRIRTTATTRLVEGVTLGHDDLVLVAAQMFEGLPYIHQCTTAGLWLGESSDSYKLLAEFKKGIPSRAPHELNRLLIDMAIINEVSCDAKPVRMIALATRLDIDTAKLKTEIIAEQRVPVATKANASKKVQSKTAQSKTTAPKTTAAPTDSTPVTVGDRVRINALVKSPLGASHIGESGTVTGPIGDRALMVKIDGCSTAISFDRTELDKISATNSAENTLEAPENTSSPIAESISTPTEAAQARDLFCEDGAKNTTQAEPAEGDSSSETAKGPKRYWPFPVKTEKKANDKPLIKTNEKPIRIAPAKSKSKPKTDVKAAAIKTKEKPKAATTANAKG